MRFYSVFFFFIFKHNMYLSFVFIFCLLFFCIFLLIFRFFLFFFLYFKDKMGFSLLLCLCAVHFIALYEDYYRSLSADQIKRSLSCSIALYILLSYYFIILDFVTSCVTCVFFFSISCCCCCIYNMAIVGRTDPNCC